MLLDVRECVPFARLLIHVRITIISVLAPTNEIINYVRMLDEHGTPNLFETFWLGTMRFDL